MKKFNLNKRNFYVKKLGAVRLWNKNENFSCSASHVSRHADSACHKNNINNIILFYNIFITK